MVNFIYRKFFIVLGLFFLIYDGFSQSEILFSDHSELLAASSEVFYLEDSTGELEAKEIFLLHDRMLKKSNANVLNFGLSNSTFWVKFKIKNLTDNNSLLLEVRHPTLDYLALYTYEKDKVVSVQELGEYKPYYERKYNHPNYLFDLNAPKDSVLTFLLQVKSDDQITLPLYIGVQHKIFQGLMNKDSIIGIYIGIMLVMIFYNSFILFSVKDIVYLYYVIYIAIIGVTQVSLHGYTFRFIWPDYPLLARLSAFILPSFAAVGAILFVQKFLKLKQEALKLNRALNVTIIIFVISVFLAALKLYFFSYQVMQLGTAISCILLLYAGFYTYRKGFSSAKYFIVAWIVLLVGAFVYVFKEVGVLPYNLFL